MAKDKEKAVVVGIVPSSKMRIRKFDPKTNICVEDRLVEQSTELRMGPKEVWKGPHTFEFTLVSQGDVDAMVDYIKKMRGDLPIEEKAAKKSTTVQALDKMLSNKEPLLDLCKTVEAKSKNQEQLISTLREYNFMFITADHLMDMAKNKEIELREKDRDLQFMIRRQKEAKDPANDKYDFRLVFGIKIIGERIELVQVYLWGKRDHYIKLPWENKKLMNFKKVEKLYVFPEMMDYAERRKWRLENAKVVKAKETNTEYKPSKFYEKWSKYIKVH